METQKSARGNSRHIDGAVASHGAWWAVAAIFYHRRLIIGITALAAIGSVILSLLLPKYYLASSRLLMPESGSLGLVGMLDDLPATAKSLLGGGSGNFTRYLAILGSRSMMERVVDEFDLIRVYELEDADHPRLEAVKTLEGNVEFVVDNEYEYLSIEVLDKSPERAAAISNYFASQLNLTNADLASRSAGTLRKYMESRYAQALATLDSVEASLQTFQEQYGVYQLDVQLEGFFTQLVEMRVAQLQADALYQTALSQYGPENAHVRALREAALTANRQYESALAGQERLLPVSQGEVPHMARRYVELERERMVQARILEALAPMVEHARLEELRERVAIQVVDQAVPPVKKEYPKRMLIVIIATLSAGMLAIFYAVAVRWWQRRSPHLTSRLSEAIQSEQVTAGT